MGRAIFDHLAHPSGWHRRPVAMLPRSCWYGERASSVRQRWMMRPNGLRTVSRRRFLHLAMLGAGLTAASSMLAACGQSAPAAPAKPAESKPAAAAPAAKTDSKPADSTAAKPAAGAATKGGTLTVGIYQEPPTFDPHVSGSATAGRVMRHIFD